MNIPIIHYNEKRTKAAFAAYRALRQRENAEPALADNPAWQSVVGHAYHNFEREFVRLGSAR